MQDIGFKGSWEDLEEELASLDQSVRALDALDDDSRKLALEAKEALEGFYTKVLRQVVVRLRDTPQGEALREALLQDPFVATGLSICGLLQPTQAQKIVTLLEYIRPQLRLQGGDVEILALDEDTLTLQTTGSLSGCGGVEIQKEIAQVVHDQIHSDLKVVFEEQVVSDATEGTPIVLGRFQEVAQLADLPESKPTPITLGSQRLLLIKLGDEVSCFKDSCAHQGLPLGTAEVCDQVITCRWHGFRFDAVSGEGLSIPGVDLERVPVLVRSGSVMVRER